MSSTAAQVALGKVRRHITSNYLALTSQGFICWKQCFDMDGEPFDSCHELDVSFDMCRARKFASTVDMQKALKELREDQEYDGKNYDIVQVFETFCSITSMNLEALNK